VARGLRFQRCSFALAAFATAFAASSTATAFRPFDGTDAAVAELYNFEFEVGPVGYLRDDRGPALVLPAIVVNAGVLPDLELVAEGRDVIRFPSGEKAHAELADGSFNLKYVLRDGVLQDKSGPSVAAEASFLIPSLEAQKAGVTLRVIASERAAPGTVHLNLQGGIDRFRHATLEGGVILEGPESWAARPVGEFAFEVHAKGDRIASGLLGMLWPVRSDLVIDMAARLGDDDGLFGELRAGFTWTLPFAKAPEKKPQERH
jgi:hypothetical protein